MDPESGGLWSDIRLEAWVRTPIVIDRKRIAVTGGLSIAAGIHLAVAGTHDLTTSHGAFFAVAGVMQLGLAVVVARRMTRTALVAAATSSAVLLATWFAQRLGPDATTGPGLLDAIASACELLVAVAAASLLLVGSTGRRRAVPRSATIALVVVAAALSLAAAPAEHDHHQAGDPTDVVPAPAERDHHRAGDPTDVVPAPVDPHASAEPHDH